MKLSVAFHLAVFGLAALHAQACDLNDAEMSECTVSSLLSATGCTQQQAIDLLGDGIDDASELTNFINSKCAYASESKGEFLKWSKVTARGYQFDEEFFDGGSIFNTDNASTVGHPDMERIVAIKDTLLESHGIAEPDGLKNFGSCSSQAAMCCWVNNRNREGGPIGTATDICSHNMYHSAKSAHVANGSAIYADSDAAVCRGFLWEDSEIFKGNLLFKVAMEQGLLNGNVRNIPGAPMCGCLEQMPVVEKASCTEITASSMTWVTEYSVETKEFTIAIGPSNVSFGDCGDFKNHYKQNIQEPDIDIDERFQTCAGDIVEKLEQHAYAKTPDSDATWVPIVGRGMYHYMPKEEEFESIWANSPNQILRRRCLECDLTHMDIYYRRFDENGLPEDLDLLNVVKNRWTEENGNAFNSDFKLYSTYEDAVADRNAWTYCNFHQDVGFPRDCGPYGWVGNQWNTFHNGRGKYNVAFYVEN